MNEKGIRQVVRLGDIRVNDGTQVRAAIAESVVAEYAEAMGEGKAFPEIVLYHDGNQYHLADGFHRVMASLRVGFVDIVAIVHGGTKSDAIWFALGANRANGHRMTDADKRHAIDLAIRTWPDRSGREIAEQIGCNQNYVSERRREVSATTHLPEKVKGKDGKSYPATRKAMPTEATTTREPVSPATAPFRSVEAVVERRDKMREMAAEGYTSAQIASAVGIGEPNVRRTLREAGVDVPADRVTHGQHRHDSNRILEHIVMDAEHLTADVGLIDFKQVDRDRLGEWIDSLMKSKRSLNSFISRLTEEHKKHGQAA